MSPLGPSAPATLTAEPLRAEELPARAAAVRDSGGRLVSLWIEDDEPAQPRLCVVLADAASALNFLEIALPDPSVRYPSLAGIFPASGRLERSARDLCGVAAEGGDPRPWLLHPAEPYPFVTVGGEGVHEIPVGPVHAGVIESGHFHLSVVGEHVLRLEERLGYKHRGITGLVRGRDLASGAPLIARLAGDTTVGYAWAYAQAAETALGLEAPPRARALRALALELERIANHLGDLGALGTDAGFAFGGSQFMILKEELLRLKRELFGRRYLFDLLPPGGVAFDLAPEAARRLGRTLETLARTVGELRDLYDDHAGLRDRFRGTGCVPRELALHLGLTGLAARASGIAEDLRVARPWGPYDALPLETAVRHGGDVLARVEIRFAEIDTSLALLRTLLDSLPPGPIASPLPDTPVRERGIGWIEAWRGPVFVSVRIDRRGAIRHVHCHDPSWENWPAVEYATVGEVVADFPLINKSFNLAYSAVDL